MTLWDSLTGRSPSSKSPSSSASSSAFPQQTTTQERTDTFQAAPFDPTTVQDVSSFLGTQGGASTFDPSSLHPLAGLNQDTLDYLTLDDTVLSDIPGGQTGLPSRGWSDDLCYGTGITYVSALTLGGLWGLREGLVRSPASAPPKLRLNSVLNAVTRRGPFLGNSAAVIAMVYNGMNSTMAYYRGKHDAVNSVTAGALSGMVFKCTRGIKPMLTSGALVAGVAGAWVVTRKALF